MGDGAITDAFDQIQDEMDKSYDDDDRNNDDEDDDEDDDENDDDYDRFAADDNDYIEEYGGRVYATKHGIPDEFPASVTIVQPSELKQISSQAPAKGEAPIRWHVITESDFATVEETKAAIEATYEGFGEKIDRTAMPGAEQFAIDAVMLSYTNDEYSVSVIASQETEYQKGPVGNFMIVYDIVVR
jgi:hypothetical protein